MKKINFITPIAMKCNEEQFNNIKPKLEQLGYDALQVFGFDNFPYLVNNADNKNGTSTNVDNERKIQYSRTILEEWDEELFLALAAMTNKEYGITGEYWVFNKDSCDEFTKDELYKANFSINKLNAFYDNNGNLNGYSSNPLNNFRKATTKEIINHFFAKEEFVLPEKWYMKGTNKMSSLRDTIKFPNELIGFYIGYYYYIHDNSIVYSLKKPEGIEITFEQFKKYVLKQETKMEKKIIGYKAPYAVNTKVNKGSIYIPFVDNIYVVKDKRAAGPEYTLSKYIVETWEPVYEEEIKIVRMGGENGFNLTITNDKVFHNNEDITSFVVNIINNTAKLNVNYNLSSKHYFVVKDMIFSRTGCEKVETKLSEWIDVYNMIK